jgi:hypothetical protein
MKTITKLAHARAFRTFIAAESKKWAKVIKDAGVETAK